MFDDHANDVLSTTDQAIRRVDRCASDYRNFTRRNRADRVESLAPDLHVDSIQEGIERMMLAFRDCSHRSEYGRLAEGIIVSVYVPS